MRAFLSTTPVDENDIRIDLAWQLFYHGHSSITEPKTGQFHYSFVNWLWDALSIRCGFLRKTEQNEVYLRIPDLDKPSVQFLVRTISPWFSEVRIGKDEKISEDVWTFPVVSINDDELEEVDEALTMSDPTGRKDRFLMPLLGPTRVFASVQSIPVNGTSARLHAHSSLDEYYLILEGEATLRMNDKSKIVRKNDFIAKPLGPDSSSQFLANRGTPVRILDIEVWPENTLLSKDLIFYPDHKELLLRGRGWGSVIPSDSSIPDDLDDNYQKGYVRKKDGSWEPADIPGYQRRKDGS